METFSIPYAGETKIQIDATYGYSNPKSDKIALITGINGQDGSYLAEWLLYNNYEVHGIVRRSSADNLYRIKHILNKITLHEGDITDASFVYSVIADISNSFGGLREVYNLAAQSHVHTSFGSPKHTFDVNTIGLLNILNAVAQMELQHIKIYQASTSEMFGNSPSPQGIDTKFDLQSPYAISKLASHELIKHYREAYGIYAVSGILFNHESPRRGEKFVTRKITKYFANIHGQSQKLQLGNIDSYRDWGFAPDYVKVMHQSLHLDQPKDFVLGTGHTISVRDLLDLVGNYVKVDWRSSVEHNSPEYLRPAEVNMLQAKPCYNVPTRVNMLVKIMIDADRGMYGRGEGYQYYMDNYGKVFEWRV